MQTKLINENVIPALKEYSTQRLQVLIGSPGSSTSVKANFLLLREDSIVFEVRGQVGAHFDALSPAVVSFVREQTLYVFVGAVLEFLPSTSAGTLTLTLPPFILQPDMRRFFRVPLVESGRVLVRMEDQGYNVLEPQLLDLSVGGMLIEFPVNEDPHLELRKAINVQLQLDERVASYLAEIRHSRTGKYGLMFVESPDVMESLRESESLRAIMSEIEQTWLQRNK